MTVLQIILTIAGLLLYKIGYELGKQTGNLEGRKAVRKYYERVLNGR